MFSQKKLIQLLGFGNLNLFQVFISEVELLKLPTIVKTEHLKSAISKIHSVI